MAVLRMRAQRRRVGTAVLMIVLLVAMGATFPARAHANSLPEPEESAGDLPLTQSETSVAVDPGGLHVVMAFNDFRGFAANPQSTTGIKYSDDGGVTFTDGGQLPASTTSQASAAGYPRVMGDPDIHYVPGGAGCQFVVFSLLVVQNTAGGVTHTLGFHRSSDCGHTWAGPFEITPASNPHGGFNTSGDSTDDADKELADVDPATGRVLVAWSNFSESSTGGVEISATFSDNIMGQTPTWSNRQVLNGGSDSFDQGAVPRFQPGGNRAYVAWSSFDPTTNGGNTAFAISINRGQTFGPATDLQSTPYKPMDDVVGNDRTQAFPAMAADTAGNVYVAYTADGGDGSDIFFQRSVNGGLSFSRPVALNAAPGSDRAQWFPWMTLDTSIGPAGRLHVVYYDQSAATSGDLTQVSDVFSDDAGATWSAPVAVTDRPFHAGLGNDLGQPNLGDYIGATSRAGLLYAAYARTSPVDFVDGLPGAGFSVPDAVVSVRTNVKRVPLLAGTPVVTDTHGDGVPDAGERVGLSIPLTNNVTNPLSRQSLSGISASLISTTPGVTVTRNLASYANAAPGATVASSAPFVLDLARAFPAGTPIDLNLQITSDQGVTGVPLSLPTGSPVATTLFSENFDATPAGALPNGWTSIHQGGATPVAWTTASALGSTSNALFHSEGTTLGWERAASPSISVPSSSQYVTVDFDLRYDLEDEPAYKVLAYDGALMSIADVTPTHSGRTVLAEAFAEDITTGASKGYPKHLPSAGSPSYMQDMAVWSGDSGGAVHVTMRFSGMAGSAISLRPDYTQDGAATCADVRPGHSCGVSIDNIVVRSVVANANAPVADGLAVSATPPSVVGGGTSQLKAVAHFTDGASRDVSALAAWAVVGGPATVDTNGLVTISGIGTVTATASIGSISGAVNIGSVPPPPQGYRVIAADGTVAGFGTLAAASTPAIAGLKAPVVTVAARPNTPGFWMAGGDGGVFSFGGAPFFGSLGGQTLNKPIVGMAATPSGQGYWMVASDGGVFTFGDAGFFGSMGGAPLNRPIVGLTPTPTGRGYWMVASDGGIFAFGDAPFVGSLGKLSLNQPIVSMARASATGYWLVAADGGVFSFGTPFFGSLGGRALPAPVVSLTGTPSGLGYWMVGADGTVYAFGDAPFLGSMDRAGKPPAIGVV